MPTSVAPIPLLRSISGLASSTSAWLVDIWGVIHNGVHPFDQAVAACRTFRDAGGVVLLLSNAPRPAASVMAQLDRIGVARTAYDGVLSSGDLSRTLIADLAWTGVYHLGPERDGALFDGLAVTLAAPDVAGAIVCTGLVDDETETAETYAGVLSALAARQVPMVCANPDLAVERGGRIIACAGAVAAKYASLGGAVVYAGKPYLPVYEAAFARLDALARSAVPRARVLAIGDGIKTDIAGAANAGIRSVFIASGVHVAGGRLDAATLAGLFPHAAVRPVAAMAELAW